MEPRRPTVSRILGGVAVALFLGTLLLWWLGTLPGHVEFPVGREIFGDIPDPLIALFYVGMAAFLALSVYLFSLRSRNWERGGPDSRRGHWRERVKSLVSALRMRTVMRDRAAGWMHAMIYWGFVVLFLGTATLEIDHLLPDGLKFLHGVFYEGYSLILDVAGVVFVAGVLWAIVRRYGVRPWRLRSKTRDEDAWILFTLAMIGITGLLVEAARIALADRPSFEVWSIVGFPLSASVLRGNRTGMAPNAMDSPRRIVHGVPRRASDHQAPPPVSLAGEHGPVDP